MSVILLAYLAFISDSGTVTRAITTPSPFDGYPKNNFNEKNALTVFSIAKNLPRPPIYEREKTRHQTQCK